jgi:serpin B
MNKVLFFFLTCLLLVSCGQDDDGTKRTKTERFDIELSGVETRIARSNDNFALNLFRQVASNEEAANLMISPLSASYALAMTTNGAAGTTLDEMKAVLGFEEYSLEEMNAFYKKLTEGLLAVDGETILGIANSIWADKDLTLLPDFINVNESNYQAEVSNLDFKSPSAVSTINDWVSGKTYGHISKLLDNTAGAAYLINALYFNGIWSEPFEDTVQETFTNADGSTTRKEMLNGKERSYRYHEAEGLQIAELPYGNGAYSMIVLLPRADMTLESTTAKLTAENWEQWMNSLYAQKLNLQLPKFEMNYGRELNDELKALGMPTAFDREHADFSNMSKVPLYISLVLQKTYIGVDEKGTEAAAATVVGMAYATAEPMPTIDFLVHRPFIYAIREQSTGTILFMGKVSELAD